MTTFLAIVVILTSLLAIFWAGFLAGEHHEQRAELARNIRRRRMAERNERGAVTGETLVTLAWVACVAWAVVVLALWWGGS